MSPDWREVCDWAVCGFYTAGMLFRSTTPRRGYGFATVLCVVGCTLLGCGQREPVALPAPAVEWIRDGKVVLGSPSLTAGVPGEGPLTLAQIEQWLDDPLQHEPLEFVLPEHLSAESNSVVIPEANPITRAKIELGRQLFFDTRLSGIGTFSCATCHRPEQSYSSYQVMPEVGRNASAAINRIFGKEHFWDGRLSLEQQPQSPIKNPFEMNSTPEKSTAAIASIPGYAIQFQRIFGEVSFENICFALASFERVLITGPSAWDNGTMSEAATRGADLFFSDRLGCADCHTGRNLTDERFHDLGTSKLTEYNDQGRFKVTGDESDRHAFKTPTLRNVARTPPYMHNGVFGTLEQVVDFFGHGGGAGDASPTPLEPLQLTDNEKLDLVEFLKSLSSELPPVQQSRLPE